MKKLSFELIRRIDFVLVFVLAVIAILVLVVEFVQDLIPIRSMPNQIPVVENHDVEIKEYLEFNRKLRDVYVFNVQSSGIRAEDDSYYYSDSSGGGVSPRLYKSSKGSYGNDGITNFIFVRDRSKEEHKLFPSNVFIYKYQFVRDAEYVDYRFHHDCNVYAVVKSDTNRDKLLNSSDDISIYVSEYDGTHLEEVSPSVISFKFIADNEFLFTEYDGAMLLYFVYDCKSGTKELIKSVEQDIELNSIDMS